MRTEIEPTRSRPPVLKRAAAGLVLLAIGALLIHVVLGVIVAIFWVAVIVAVVVAVAWALKTIIW